MLTPAAKRRRRAEAATATLARPFRSPAVRRAGVSAGPRAGVAEAAEPAAPAAPPSTDGAASPAPSPPDRRKHKRLRCPTPEGPLEGEEPPPVKAPAGEQPRALASLMDQFGRDLDAGDQALEAAARAAGGGAARRRAPGGDQDEANADADADADGELPALITRWREAGRLAAEDVFATVAERVSRAGGVKAWRDMATLPAPVAENRRGGDGEDEDEDEGRGEGGDEDEGEDAREEDGPRELTMAVMLASLHADPDLLGYDEVEERWKD